MSDNAANKGLTVRYLAISDMLTKSGESIHLSEKISPAHLFAPSLT